MTDLPGLIRLHPTPDVSFDCPRCDASLAANGWYMPGMRILAELHCLGCGREFYGDLPTGDTWDAPALIERETGRVYADRDDFMTTWLRRSYADRSDRSTEVDIDRRHDVERPAVLNCLDAMYGHSLLKLLSAQYYVDQEDIDLIVIVPRILEWCVPDGVAEVWTVDLPLSRGFEWNDALATQFARRLEVFEDVNACRVPPQPVPETFDIERFTGVSPFPMSEWAERSPTVTFVWREDRFWAPIPPAVIVRDWLGGQVSERLRANFLVASAGEFTDSIGRMIQRRRIRRLATALRDRRPDVDFAVAGLGTSGEFADWIDDRRVASPDDDDDERALCRQYARSHVVVGVHGSNMLLPSAHAGGAIDLMPDRRWGNVGQDLLPRSFEGRRASLYYHMLPLDTSSETVAELIVTLLEKTNTVD
jgi:hypothetical protein